MIWRGRQRCGSTCIIFEMNGNGISVKQYHNHASRRLKLITTIQFFLHFVKEDFSNFYININKEACMKITYHLFLDVEIHQPKNWQGTDAEYMIN